jgi:glucose-6-phosphate dehydrogenase assembly protein OpcA
MSGDRLADFEKGDSIEVPLNRIEAELAHLWRQAAEPKGDEKKRTPVTRACLWNLIVRVGGEEFRAAKRLIDDVSKAVPARVIVLRAEPLIEEQPIRAWVEANWRQKGGGPHGASGSDEVTLFATGKAADKLPSLVRSLQVSDAPTAMLWWGPPPSESASVRELLREVDRLIVDSRKIPSEDGLEDYRRIGEALPDLELVDCAWLGVRPLRGLLAAMFDPPGDPRRLEALDRLRVVSGVQGCQSRALLTIGWLASRLGWSHYTKEPAPGSVRRWRARRRDGGSVLLELENKPGGPPHGVAEIELTAGSDRWSIDRAHECIDVRGPNVPPRTQPARKHTDAELVVSGLGARGRDPIFRDALNEAAQLVAIK